MEEWLKVSFAIFHLCSLQVRNKETASIAGVLSVLIKSYKTKVIIFHIALSMTYTFA